MRRRPPTDTLGDEPTSEATDEAAPCRTGAARPANRSEPSVRTSWRAFFALFGLALAARLLYWWLVTPDWVPRADADQYLVLARSLAHGDGFAMVFPQLDLHATAFRPPLYPIVLTPGAWLFGDAVWPARLLTAALGSTAVVLAAVLARRLGDRVDAPADAPSVAGRRAFWVTGALMVVYPPLLANDTVTLTEPLAMVLLLAALLALDDGRWVACGFACGLLVLARPNGYLVVPLVALFLVHSVGWRKAAATAGIAVLCVVPWVVRNQVQVDTTRLVTSDGFTMAAIYAAEAQERGSFVDPVFDPAFDDPAYRWAQFDEAAWSRVLTDAAIDGVRDNPGYVLRTVRTNAGAYFELRPSQNRWAEDNDGRNWDFRTAGLPAFYLVTLAGLAGIGWSIRDRRVWPLAVIVAQFVVLSLVLVAPPRLRTPFDVMCCIGVGLLAARLARPSRAAEAAEAGDAAVDADAADHATDHADATDDADAADDVLARAAPESAGSADGAAVGSTARPG